MQKTTMQKWTKLTAMPVGTHDTRYRLDIIPGELFVLVTCVAQSTVGSRSRSAYKVELWNMLQRKIAMPVYAHMLNPRMWSLGKAKEIGGKIARDYEWLKIVGYDGEVENPLHEEKDWETKYAAMYKHVRSI